jgi:hypothetical protein
MNHHGMSTKVTVSDKSMAKHLDHLKAATSTTALNDSLITKMIALNLMIGGWCRYFQHTHDIGRQFKKLSHAAFWDITHWLAAKLQISVAQVMKRFHGLKDLNIHLHQEFKHKRYANPIRQPNPYTTMTDIEREELLNLAPWWGNETRPGQADLKAIIIERDEHRCRMCGKQITPTTSVLDHVRGFASFKKPVNANVPNNLWTLCLDCHANKHAKS